MPTAKQFLYKFIITIFVGSIAISASANARTCTKNEWNDPSWNRDGYCAEKLMQLRKGLVDREIKIGQSLNGDRETLKILTTAYEAAFNDYQSALANVPKAKYQSEFKYKKLEVPQISFKRPDQADDEQINNNFAEDTKRNNNDQTGKVPPVDSTKTSSASNGNTAPQIPKSENPPKTKTNLQVVTEMRAQRNADPKNVANQLSAAQVRLAAKQKNMSQIKADQRAAISNIRDTDSEYAEVGTRFVKEGSTVHISKSPDNSLNKDQAISEIRAKAREQKQEQRAAIKSEKQNIRKLNKLAIQESQIDDIMLEAHGAYGGRYGGERVEKTQTVNAVVETAAQLANQVSESQLINRNGQVQSNLVGRGSSATQVDAVKSQIEMMNNGKKNANRMATLTAMGAAVQGLRVQQHLSSGRKVDATAAAAQNRLAGHDPAEVAQIQDTIARNQAGEKAAQKELAFSQAAQVSRTMLQAGKLRTDARTMAAQAKMLEGQARQMGNNGFVFNPNPLNPQNPNDPSLSPGQDPGGLQPGEELPGDQMAGLEPFDPNLNDGGLPGPAPGEFRPKEGNDQGLGMGGPGLAAGGTTAAQEGQGEGGEAPGKSQVGGSYASGDEGGGSRFGRGGSGGGIGDSLANFFEKFLPEKEQVDEGGKLPEELAERNLASDGPAVLGKNKNIFEEISKKYQKKSSEGAVAFSGDRS